MSSLHIHAPKGNYVAQVRRRGCRNWETLGQPTKSKATAANRAVTLMLAHENYKRARVLFCAEWYDPIVVMEASV
ncbi:hypothetical protein WCE03_16765 [Pseudomonas guariconensis]|uniref:hypothetical protein n=1 Tax=Pseudomonas guariconensis TaxID=1288410 RepID=UPI0034D3C32C